MRTIERVSRIGNYDEGRFGKTSAASVQQRSACAIAKKNSLLRVPASITYTVLADGTRIFSGVH